MIAHDQQQPDKLSTIFETGLYQVAITTHCCDRSWPVYSTEEPIIIGVPLGTAVSSEVNGIFMKHSQMQHAVCGDSIVKAIAHALLKPNARKNGLGVPVSSPLFSLLWKLHLQTSCCRILMRCPKAAALSGNSHDLTYNSCSHV